MILRRVLTVLAGAACLAGCAPAEVDIGPANTVVSDGLSIRLELPTRIFTVGQQLRMVLTVENTTRQPAGIPAASGAPVYARIQRFTGLGWEEVKRYPQAATMVMSPWTLPARTSRTFVLTLPVEPDWPTNEPLRIVAELNGRPRPAPMLTVEVLPAPRP